MEKGTTLKTAFDADNEDGTPTRELLPPGGYEAEITSATVGQTKNGKGQMVNLAWVVTSGEFENRHLFQNILVQHESVDAQRFGRQKFKDVCTACGVTGQVSDLDVLLHKPCSIAVSIKKDKNGEYPDKNEVARVQPRAVTTTNRASTHGDMSDAIPF